MSLSISRANKDYTSYGFTLRRVKMNKDVTKELYFDHLIRIFDQFCFFTDLNYELTGGLHCHGIVRICNSIGLHRFRVRGWSLVLEELYDRYGWVRYITKDQHKDCGDSDPFDGDDYEPNGDFKMPTKKLFRPISSL